MHIVGLQIRRKTPSAMMLITISSGATNRVVYQYYCDLILELYSNYYCSIRKLMKNVLLGIVNKSMIILLR